MQKVNFGAHKRTVARVSRNQRDTKKAKSRTEIVQAADNNEPKRRKLLTTDTETAQAADNSRSEMAQAADNNEPKRRRAADNEAKQKTGIATRPKVILRSNTDTGARKTMKFSCRRPTRVRNLSSTQNLMLLYNYGCAGVRERKSFARVCFRFRV